MPPERVYLTTSIPYVNARPHLGFALELVQADALVRHRRLRGDEVRLLTGTDDNSLKNVLAALAEGIPTAQLVERNALHFLGLQDALQVAVDDFIRTTSIRVIPRGWNASGVHATQRAISTRRPIEGSTASAASSSMFPKS